MGTLYEESGCNERTLSEARNEVLLKSTFQAILVYTMSLFKLPLSLCGELEKMVGKFRWENKKEGSDIYWVA